MDYLTAINNHSVEVNAVSSHGNYLVSGDQGGTVYVFNISDKNSPTQIATLTDHGASAINDIALNKDVLATVGDDNTVKLYDMSDPTTPNLVNTFTDHTASVTSVALFKDMLFTGAEDNDVRVYDITDPSTPSSLNTSTQASSVTSLAVDTVEYDNSDDTLDALAVGLSNGAVEVFDISTPTSFTSKSSFTDHTDIVESVDLEKNVLVTGSADNTVKVYNLITPNGYTLLNTLEDSTDTIFAVKMYNNLLVTGSRDNSFRIYNVSNVQMIDLLDSSSEHGNWVLDIEINKDLLITSSRDNSVRLNNISLYGAVLGLTPPLKPMFVDQGYPSFRIDRDRFIKTFPGSVTYNNNNYSSFSYISKDETFMYIIQSGYIDIYKLNGEDIGDAEYHSYLDAISLIYGIDVDEDNNILVTVGYSGSTDGTTPYVGIKFWDISDPFNPTHIDNCTIHNHYVFDVIVKNNIMYTCSNDATIKISDISDPLNVTILSEINTINDNIISISLENNVLGAVGDFPSVELYDISDQNNPVFINSIPTSHRSFDIQIKNNLLLMGASETNDRSKLYDISDPTNPELLYDFNVDSRAVSLEDNYVFIGTYSGLAYIYDISDINNIEPLSINKFYDERLYGIRRYRNRLLLSYQFKDPMVANIYDIINSNDIDNMEVKLNDNTIQTETTGFPKVTNVDFGIPELEYLQNGRNFLDVTITDKAGISETASLGIIAEVFDKPQPGNILRFGNTMRFENEEYEITDIDYDTENYYLTLNKQLNEDLPVGSELELMNMEFTPMVYLTSDVNDEPSLDDYQEMEYRSTGYRRNSNGDELAAVEEYQLENVSGEYAFFRIKGERTAPLAGVDFEGGDRFGGMVLENEISNVNSVVSVNIFGDLLTVVEKTVGMHLYDVSDIYNIKELALIEKGHTDWAYDRVIKYNDIIVVQYNDSDTSSYVSYIDLYDISDPSNPVLLSTITFNDGNNRWIFSTYISEINNTDILVAGGISSDVYIYDISDPSNPVLLSTITDHEYYIRSTFIKDNILASGSADDTVKLYDISDPSNPVLLSTITDHTDDIISIFIKDNILASGSEDNTVKLFDISDPSNPVLLSTITDHTSNVYSVFINDNILASGSYDNTAKLYDISDPSNPVLLSTITDHTGAIYSVTIKDGFLISSSSSGVVKIHGGLRSEIVVKNPWVQRPRAMFSFASQG
jgi:WD40 repeat protein